METVKQKIKTAYKTLGKDFGYNNIMQSPKIEKVVISAGVGSFKDKKKVVLALDRITRITGQKPLLTKAKKSISNFKLREGQAIGAV